jgi:outer membrane protein assembly factor BamB
LGLPAADVAAKNVRLTDPEGILANEAGPVSIVRIDDKLYVAANYGRLYAIDTNTAEARPISVQWDIKPTAFVPTGLAYDPSSRTLFIANYTANNLLSGRLDPAIGRLTISEEIGAGTVVSAEGISYDADRKWLASAQYDGNSVALFAQTSDGWRLDCLLPVPQAHGVAIAGAYLFATSLKDRKLLKINAQSCAVEGSLGELGWDAKHAGFMWPTTVQRLSDGVIAVSDAHTGHISLIDPERMKVRASFGRNGPGFGALNMPYGFTETDDGNLLVLSTFGSRLIELSRSGRFVRSYSAGPAWPDRYKPETEAMLGGTSWLGYRNVGRSAHLFGKCIVGGYASLSSCGGERTISLPLLSDGPLSSSLYYYFTEVADAGAGMIAVSAQNRTALYIAPTATALALIPVPIGLDSWIDGRVVARPSGNLLIDSLAATLDYRVRRLADDISASGGLAVVEIAGRLVAFANDRSAVNPGAAGHELPALSDAERDAAVKAILTHFRDPVGERFVEDSAECSGRGCSEERRCLIAAPMAASLQDAPALDIVRLAIASQMNRCLWPAFLDESEKPRAG